MQGRRFRRRPSNPDAAIVPSSPQPSPPRRTVADLLSVGHSSSGGVIDYSTAVPSVYSSTSAGGEIPDTFVTQPPRSKGLTGKISTLFRRESSRERADYSHSDAVVSSSGMGSSSSAALSPNSSRESASLPRTKRRSHSADRVVPVAEVPTGRHRRVQSRTEVSAVPSQRQSKLESQKLARQHSSTGKRIFYSSHQDDDSDDSYESRASQASRSSRGSRARRNHKGNTTDEGTRTSGSGAADYSTSFTEGGSIGSAKLIKRYRGFSTSIQSLFLDESLVCGAFGCFGLILSNRTEYLLQLRNERRGVANSKHRQRRSIMPSRIIATGLVLTLLLMFSTFIIWGFGKGDNVAQSYLNGYDYHDDAVAVAATDDANDGNNANGDDVNRRGLEEEEEQPWTWDASTHRRGGVAFTLLDYKEVFWDPLRSLVKKEWYRDATGQNLPMASAGHRREEEKEAAANDDANAAENNSSSSSNGSGTVYERDVASDIRMALFFCFLLFLGVLGRRRRMRTRFHLVRARAQEDHLYYASSDEAAARRVAFDDTREDQYEGACSHTLCGCYPLDEVDTTVDDENVQVTDSGIFRRKLKPHNEDIVARALNCLMATCCGVLCRCWFQCLSICALAQEAREVRLLIPPRYQRIDYITHQPFHEYQEAVNDLRRGWLGKARRISGIMPHYHALSRLSRYILLLSFGTVVSILSTLLFNPRAAFSWQDAVILLATFLQSFLVLFIVHGIFHKSDLSLDAVIKLFAAGFLIAVPTAYFFEGLLVNIFYFGVFILYDTLASLVGESFSNWVDIHWRVIWLIGELCNAFIVAAVTEELCKYYTFRCVEHPDLVFLTGLQRESQEEDAVDGGLVKYPFASHQVQELSRKRSFRDDGSVSEHSHRSSHSNRSRSRNRRSEVLIEKTGTTDAEFDEDERDVRTRRQKAMAITTGMISVAVGLACAENFVYVFVLGGAGGDDRIEAWVILFFRSIFPVHALAAAMQSINMIRKFVEFDNQNGHRVGVGRIILPAVVIHGSFDAVLMGINVFVVTATDNYDANYGGNGAESTPYNAFIVNLVAWVSIVGIMLLGLLWYYRENRKQRARLKILEEQDKAIQEDQWINGTNSRDNDEDIL
jgi:hypothetical protein